MRHKKLLAGVLATALFVTVAFATYNLITASVNVSVGEPITFGINYVGWEAPPNADLPGGYYSTSSEFTCSIAMYAGEKSHGDPTLPEAIRDLMPILTVGSTPAESIPSPYHTFNSFIVVNNGRLDMDVTFTVSGQTGDIYMVVWEYPDVYTYLNGYTVTVPAGDFIMHGIGVVAEADATPGSHTFTLTVSRG